MLEYILDIVVPIIIHLLEAMGVFIIFFSAVKAFFQYARRIFDFSDESIKINFARALALGLEFKMGAEILKTLLVRTLDEMLILASVVIIRIILTFVIHWEIKSETVYHQQS
ncbi:putative membrane protein [Garciella nitratireducens]|nr:putative membrane protein [Garciella nitratireducens]